MGNWRKIRLELARTSAFPTGSVSRGYLILLPLDGEGRVDSKALAARPDRASVQRYWSTEPDESGTVERVEGGLALRCNGDGERTLLLDGMPFRLGEQISVVEVGGETLPFTVASIR